MLSQLENIVADKNWNDVKNSVELAVRLIKQPENSIHNAHNIFLQVVTQLYSERYLLVLEDP